MTKPLSTSTLLGTERGTSGNAREKTRAHTSNRFRAVVVCHRANWSSGSNGLRGAGRRGRATGSHECGGDRAGGREKVYEAANADEAIELLERNPDVTLLFTDIDMPGTVDGLKLAESTSAGREFVWS